MGAGTGSGVADAVAREISGHSHRDHPRHFTLPESVDGDLRSLTAEVWSDLAHVGSLWSTVRVVHNGDDVHPSRFMRARVSDGLVVHSAIDSQAVARYVDLGATLIYNHLHETSRAVQRIQEILEYRINAKVWIQAYVTKAGETAFGLHRDDHNFVVLQLAGVKKWQTASADGEPVTSHLRAGDGIFLRSGTDHAVSGVGELSLHLTIAFDWLTAVPEQPGSTVSEAELAAHRSTYRIGTFIPVAADPSMLEPATRVRGAGRAGPDISDDGNGLTYRCASGSFRFDKRLRPALEIISRGGETSAKEMSDASALGLPEIESFVRFSVRKGILLCVIQG